MEFIVIWLACGLISAMIGSKKGAGCSGFIVGMLLGPLGIVAALITRGNRKTCPFCKELIHKDAVVCPRCQKDQPNDGKPKSFMDGLKKGLE